MLGPHHAQATSVWADFKGLYAPSCQPPPHLGTAVAVCTWVDIVPAWEKLAMVFIHTDLDLRDIPFCRAELSHIVHRTLVQSRLE